MSEKKQDKIVYVLGAGFTKTFCDDAILGKVLISQLKKGFDRDLRSLVIKKLRHLKIKNTEEESNKNYQIDLEYVLSRLHENTPYDDLEFGSGLKEMLYKQVVNGINRALKSIPSGGKHTSLTESKTESNLFISHILKNKHKIITFNYDTYIDGLLYAFANGDNSKWHPEGGYGFYLKPDYSVLMPSSPNSKDQCSTEMYKLHGSLNWFHTIGSRGNPNINSLVHSEKWCSRGEEFIDFLNEKLELEPNKENRERTIKDIEDHIEQTPFIVPPLLNKQEIQHPVLQVVWKKAYEALAEADKVIFMGYSMPPTDLAARFLFNSALGKRSDNKPVQVDIVGKPLSDKEKKDLDTDNCPIEKKINLYKDRLFSVNKGVRVYFGIREYIIDFCRE